MNDLQNPTLQKYRDQFARWDAIFLRRGERLADLYQLPDRRLFACRHALSLTRHIPEHDRLEVINALLGLHGVEAIRGERQNGYWGDIVATYCNTGDTYALTVLHVRGSFRGAPGKFIVSSWGDWVEKNGEKFGVN